MAFSRKTTAIAGRSRKIPGSEVASPNGHRRVRFRAAFLVIAWSLPGLWSVGHVLEHERASEHEAHHAEISSGGPVVEVSCNHGHDHVHPESPPAISAEWTKKLDAPVLLTATVELDHSNANLQWRMDATVTPLARLAVAASGPRAPPIS